MAALALVLGVSSVLASGEDDVRLALAGHLGGTVRAVVLTSDDLAIVGEGIGITVLDASGLDARSPGVPGLVHHLALGTGAEVYGLALAEAEDLVVVGAADGLHVVHLEPNGTPSALAHVPTRGTVEAVSVAAMPGGQLLAFASDNRFGLYVVDVTAPAAPVVLAGFPVAGGLRAPVMVHGTLALAPGPDLVVLGLDPGGRPAELSRLALGGPVRSVWPMGDLAYVSAEGTGLSVVDLADPEAPVVVGEAPGLPPGVLRALGDEVLLLADGGDRIELLDLTSPRSPVVVEPAPFAGLDGVHGLGARRDGGRLALARGTQLTLVDTGEPADPATLGGYRALTRVTHLEALADVMYVVHQDDIDDESLLAIVDISSPDAARVIARNRAVHGVFVRGDGIAFLSLTTGFLMVDVSDPRFPASPVAFAPDWAATSWIAASNNMLAAVTADTLYVAVFRKQPLAPEAMAAEPVAGWPGWPANAQVQGIAMAPRTEVAYLAAGPAGVAVVDLIDPERPTPRRYVDVGADALVVAVRNNLLAVGTPDGVALLDLSDARKPRLLSRPFGGFWATDLAVAPGRIYVAADATGGRATGDTGLVVLDVNVPDAPTVIGRYRTTGFGFNHVALADGRVYASGAGLHALDPDPLPGKTPAAGRPTVTPRPGTPTAPVAVPTTTPQPSPTTATLTPTPDGPRRTPTANMVRECFLPVVMR